MNKQKTNEEEINGQEMSRRYIYEVTRRLPQSSREDIRLELQSLIEDMCAEEQISAQDALQKLGDPDELAKRYRGDGNYLIGPQYYDNYLWVVKIAFAGIGLSAVLSAIMQGVFHIGSGAAGFLSSFLKELLSTAVYGSYSVIGIITIIFAVMERRDVKLRLKPETNWSVKELLKHMPAKKPWAPALLPPVPDKRALISRGDSVVSIIFISLLSVLLSFSPQLFGAVHYENGNLVPVACIFNLDRWPMVLPVLLLWLLTGMVDEIIRLVTGCYCKIVMYSCILCNTIQIILAAALLKALPLWNPAFTSQLKQAAGITRFSKGDLLHYWGSGTISNILLAGICLVSLAEMGVVIYKTRKYAVR